MRGRLNTYSTADRGWNARKNDPIAVTVGISRLETVFAKKQASTITMESYTKTTKNQVPGIFAVKFATAVVNDFNAKRLTTAPRRGTWGVGLGTRGA